MDNFEDIETLTEMPFSTEIDLGVDPEHGRIKDVESNIQRATKVCAVLSWYATRKSSSREEAETVLTDFLADMMHLCRMNNVDFDVLVEKARMHYDVEKESIY